MNGPATAAVIVEALRAALLALAVKGTIVFVLAYAVTRFAGSLTAERRHQLWLVVLLVSASLPVAQLAVPVVRVPLLEPLAPAAGRRQAPAPADPLASHWAAGGHAAAQAGEAGGTKAGGAPLAWIPLALAGAWGAGAIAVLCRPVAGRIALARVRRSGGVTAGPDALLRELAGSAGVRSVRVLAHPRAAVPFACGIFRPVIFLPDGWPSWRHGRLQAVLVHELAHVRRGDALANAAAQLACALVWFYPPAWIARRMMHLEAEASCDRAVLDRGVSRADYASMIVEILRRAGSVPLHGSWSTLGERKLLRQRVSRILRPAARPTGASLLRGRLLAFALCLAAPAFLLSVSLRGTDQLFGTWERPRAALLGPADGWNDAPAPYAAFPDLQNTRTTWNPGGAGSMAYAAVPDLPAQVCRYTIEERWKDAGGSTWYRILARWSAMPFPLYVVIRLHPSGRLYELTDSPLGYPTGFIGPPGDEKHQVFVRR